MAPKLIIQTRSPRLDISCQRLVVESVVNCEIVSSIADDACGHLLAPYHQRGCCAGFTGGFIGPKFCRDNVGPILARLCRHIVMLQFSITRENLFKLWDKIFRSTARRWFIAVREDESVSNCTSVQRKVHKQLLVMLNAGAMQCGAAARAVR